MTLKASDSQYGWPHHSDNWASCFVDAAIFSRFSVTKDG